MLTKFMLPAAGALAVIMGAGYGVNHYQALQGQLTAAQAQLTASQSALAASQGQLAAAKSELGQVGADIATATQALEAAKNLIPPDAVAPPADPQPAPAIGGLQ